LPTSALVLNKTVHFRPDAYCCVAENLESASYPGLACVYITHYCRIDILEEGVKHLMNHGLPSGIPFETKEHDKINRWKWSIVEEARRDEVKGFPKITNQSDSADATTAVYEKIVAKSDTLGVSSLSAMLEMGGVNISSWGAFTNASLHSLLHELQSGASHLERDLLSGKVRRVLSSSMVQMVVHERNPQEIDDLEAGTPGLAQDSEIAEEMADEKNICQYRPDLSCFEIVHLDVLSYPGLPCVHQTQRVQFKSHSSNIDSGLSSGQIKSPFTSEANGVPSCEMEGTLPLSTPTLPTLLRDCRST